MADGQLTQRGWRDSQEETVCLTININFNFNYKEYTYALACTRKIDVSCGLQVAPLRGGSLSSPSATRNPQLTLIFGMINSLSSSRKQALAFGKKPNARFAVLQTAIRGCTSAILITKQILALHSAFTRIQGTEDSVIGKTAQTGVFCSNFALWFRWSTTDDTKWS